MVNFIRPKDLPAAASVSGSSSVPVDSGTAVEKATPKQIVDAGRPIATESQAIAGTDNTTTMTPLTVRQALDADTEGVAASAAASAAAAADSEVNAAQSEANAAASEDAAEDAAAAAADDAVATAADRVQTGLDATATAADRVQTGLDATATAADRVQTGLDATATAADRVQTGEDVAAAAAWAGQAEESQSALGYSVFSSGAVSGGVVDSSEAFTDAFTKSELVIIPPGTFLIDENITVPEGITVKFMPGAVVSIGAGVVITWNGGVEASAFQKLFDGSLVHSAFSRTTRTPYTFALQGSPQVEWASAYWFGAAGDGVSDDTVEIYSALYWAGRAYCPRGTYLIGEGANSGLIELRHPGQELFGEGALTVIKADGSADDGSVVGFRGLAPSTSSGDPQEWMERGVIRDLVIDGADATNTNGLGFSFAKNNSSYGVNYRNIGRKAVTLQYHCKSNQVFDSYIEDAATESGSTAGAISLEGQRAGISYAAVGGVSSTDDLQGSDVEGNIVQIKSVVSSGYNYIVVDNSRDNAVTVGTMGDAVGSGSHIIFARAASGNKVSFGRAGNSERRFIYAEADTSRNFVEGDWFGDCSGSLTTGYAIEDLGEGNTYSGFSFSHSNTNTAQNSALRFNGPSPQLINLTCRACAEVTVLEALSGSTRANINGCKFDVPDARPMRIQGAGSKIKGGYFDCSTATTGIQIDANDVVCVNNEITGNSAARIKLGSGSRRAVITGNRLTGGASAAINVDSDQARFTSSVYGNPGDTGSVDHLPMGGQSLWVDATGAVRVGAAIVASDTSGTKVGTQT